MASFIGGTAANASAFDRIYRCYAPCQLSDILAMESSPLSPSSNQMSSTRQNVRKIPYSQFDLSMRRKTTTQWNVRS